MAYTKTTWVDRVLAGTAPTYTISGIGTGQTVELEPSSITTEGTGVTAARMNNIEQGIENPDLIAKYYMHDQAWQCKSGDNSVIQSPNEIKLRIDTESYYLTAQIELDVDVAGDWDTTSGTDYTVAANRAGKDFYFYAVQPSSGTVPEFVLSANSTVPSGYTASNSRKLGGFHCECADVGTISGHDLSGYLAGDILPASVWDLFHRAVSGNEGMVYSEQANIWVDIYLASGTGSSTASANGATISDIRSWLDFVDDFAAVKKSLLSDFEFQIIAAGSNEETNISGSADPVTTGGHSDTAGRRMVSNIGVEDAAGAMWQWLSTPSARLDDGTAGAWYNLPGAKGSFYTYGTNSYGNTQLRAGGIWADGAYCGSRTRRAAFVRWNASSSIGGRGRSEPRVRNFL
ncbi:MAG: hypothetical protein DSY80_08950 [Desulfocapsa sp.]|nr:MAG: hypothetical protein DSY80_08950 [Desulfocapsa sp.]